MKQIIIPGLFLPLMLQSIPAEICIPPGEKGEPGLPGKPGVCDCDLEYGGDVKKKLQELNNTVNILRAQVSAGVVNTDVKCTVPAPPIYGVIYSASHIASFGERITIKCGKGFEIDGFGNAEEIISICQNNGTWTKHVPVCRAITCPVPATPNLVSASTSRRRLEVAANITYTCHEGYKVTGTESTTERNATCLGNGSMSDGPPTCAPFHCSVGFKDGRVRDEQISASSFYNSDWLPHYGRLDKESSTFSNGGTWLPGRGFKDEWIQVDLINPQRVTGVVTQGYPESLWWVTGYKISYGNATSEMHFIQSDYRDEDLIFGANPYDGDSHSVNKFREPVTARFFRLTVDSFINSSPTLRMDYLTC